MSDKRWYWTFVRLDPSGGSRVEELAAVREFFQQHFQQPMDAELADISVQKQLIDQVRTGIEIRDRTLARLF